MLANVVSDSPLLAARVGAGAAARLKWDVRLYFALNGAVHDAAIAAWGIKREYNGVRPISMIRYLAGKGQSSDPAAPSYDREGLPLVPGLIEVVTAASSAPGQRHAALAGARGRDRRALVARQGRGVGWELGVDLVDLPAPDVRHPRVSRLRLRPQHLQPRRGGGDDARSPAARTSPAASSRRRFAPGAPEARAGPERAGDAPGCDLLRRGRPGRDLHASTAASTSPPTTTPAVGSARPSASGAWALAQRYFDGSARR